ncbi:tail fiber assembly protein [Caballeronia sp. AZ10_KS36]|uniref:tail fiber assembly protein n=1 Tax=Caballeronia sp. AZ10_KS36 TaxID=2921757 RepID=UPI002027BBF0|nr:tail fiber assembly protein [Caballeronia sp. AZ10_KS36]
MSTYAYIDDNVVREIITPVVWPQPDESAKDSVDPDTWAAWVARTGQEIAIADRYTPEFVAQCVDIGNINPVPQVGWVYDGSTFGPAPVIGPTPEQIAANNTAMRDNLLGIAALAIAPLQDAVDIDEATDAETTLLKQWKQYRVAVSRVDLTQASPVWPTAPAN